MTDRELRAEAKRLAVAGLCFVCRQPMKDGTYFAEYLFHAHPGECSERVLAFGRCPGGDRRPGGHASTEPTRWRSGVEMRSILASTWKAS